MKIVLLPLDERPCNSIFPQELPLNSEITFVVAPISLLSQKKKVCDIAKLHEWLINECKDADYALIALDTLLYGGIVPSRLHHDKYETIIKRSEVLRVLKKNNPKLKIYVNELIMRTPSYSNSTEEPDYFDHFGRQLWEYGYYLDKEQLNIITSEERKKLSELYKSIPQACLKDLLTRRDINKRVTINNLKYLLDGTISYFIIPQDDCAPYGFTSIDRREINKFLVENELHRRVVMYPGADEAGMVLVSAAMNDFFMNHNPKIYVKYSCDSYKDFIPDYEDRPASESIKTHIHNTKAINTIEYGYADIVLAVNVPNTEESLKEFVSFIKKALNDNKIVGISDIAICNRGDMRLFNELHKEGLLDKIHAYAGWNTASNSTGTVLANLITYFYSENEEKRKFSLISRYLEDVFYMNDIRDHLNNVKDVDIEKLDSYQESFKQYIVDEMNKNVKKYNLDKLYEYKELRVYFPWNRTFEIGLEVKKD